MQFGMNSQSYCQTSRAVILVIDMEGFLPESQLFWSRSSDAIEYTYKNTLHMQTCCPYSNGHLLSGVRDRNDGNTAAQ